MVLFFYFSGVPISWEGTFSECFDFPKVSLRFQSTKLERFSEWGDVFLTISRTIRDHSSYVNFGTPPHYIGLQKVHPKIVK